MALNQVDSGFSLKFVMPVSKNSYPHQFHCSTDRSSPISLDVDEADPRPVHDRVPEVDRLHMGSSSDGARPVHEWIHRCTSVTHSPRLRHVYFSRSNDRRAPDVNRFWTVTLEVDVTFRVTLDRDDICKRSRLPDVNRNWTRTAQEPKN
jgi:hypothetical protein